MKRKIVTLLVTSMVIGAGLCACTSNSQNDNVDDNTPVVVDEVVNGEDEPLEGVDDMGNAIVNPMQESTVEEIEKTSGKTMVIPDGLEVVSAWQITYGETIYEIILSDGTDEYCYRFQNTSEYQDISGMYFDWDEDYTADSPNNATADVDYYYGVTNNGEGVANWFDGEWSYAISMSEGATADKLAAMYKMLAE